MVNTTPLHDDAQNPSKNATLHLLLISAQEWTPRLSDLKQLWQPHDQLLLLASALHGWDSEQLLDFSRYQPVGLYQPDAAHVPLPCMLPAHLTLVSTELWARWSVQYARCITWR